MKFLSSETFQLYSIFIFLFLVPVLQHSDEWTDVLTGSMAQTSKTPAEGDLEEYRSNECVYYLRTYGNHSALISFYVRHSCWMKAARYILDNVRYKML